MLMSAWGGSKDVHPSIEQLALSARDGDDVAMASLIAEFGAQVKWCSLQFTGSPLEPEDLAQEGMLGLLSAVYSYNPDAGASFRTYASVCISNRISSAVKSSLSKKHTPLNSYISFNDGSDLPDNIFQSPEEVVISKEAVLRLESLLEERLSYFEREVIGLFLGGYSYKEIAKRIGSDAKSVDNALQRIRRKLRHAAQGDKD